MQQNSVCQNEIIGLGKVVGQGIQKVGFKTLFSKVIDETFYGVCTVWGITKGSHIVCVSSRSAAYFENAGIQREFGKSEVKPVLKLASHFFRRFCYIRFKALFVSQKRFFVRRFR